MPLAYFTMTAVDPYSRRGISPGKFPKEGKVFEISMMKMSYIRVGKMTMRYVSNADRIVSERVFLVGFVLYPSGDHPSWFRAAHSAQ